MRQARKRRFRPRTKGRRRSSETCHPWFTVYVVAIAIEKRTGRQRLAACKCYAAIINPGSFAPSKGYFGNETSSRGRSRTSALNAVSSQATAILRNVDETNSRPGGSPGDPTSLTDRPRRCSSARLRRAVACDIVEIDNKLRISQWIGHGACQRSLPRQCRGCWPRCGGRQHFALGRCPFRPLRTFWQVCGHRNAPRDWRENRFRRSQRRHRGAQRRPSLFL